MDALYATYLRRLARCDESLEAGETGEVQPPVAWDEASFATAVPGAVWTVRCADGRSRDLLPGGGSLPLSFAARGRFAGAALAHRLAEFDAPAAAIRRGLGNMVPPRALALFTPEQLEALVTGERDVDLGRLRAATTYRSPFSATHPTMALFWRVLASLTPGERCKYLRFVWGRARLPPPTATATWQHTITCLCAGQGADRKLPLSHTCFCTIDLPAYTTEERMRWGLLTAIHCGLGGILKT